jgi:N-acyl-D-aspartate/D-glutamate deacylase
MTSQSKMALDSRPREYTTEIGSSVCERLFQGESLRAICADAGMPDRATIRDWLVRHPQFRQEYDWALQDRAEMLAGEAVEIAFDDKGDYVEKVNANGKVVRVFDRYNFARWRLRCEMRQWVGKCLLEVRESDKE